MSRMCRTMGGGFLLVLVLTVRGSRGGGGHIISEEGGGVGEEGVKEGEGEERSVVGCGSVTLTCPTGSMIVVSQQSHIQQLTKLDYPNLILERRQKKTYPPFNIPSRVHLKLLIIS